MATFYAERIDYNASRINEVPKYWRKAVLKLCH